MRADLFLFRYGYAKSRQAAKLSIISGFCSCDGRQLVKPADDIDESVQHEIIFTPAVKYVGRGGIKLEAALDAFSVDPSGKVCLDIGASTGGFTDCLLKRNARKVYSIDSGKNQLAQELRNDSRVVSLEGYNARYLNPSDVDGECELVVMDVSFISQTLIFPKIPACMTAEADLITLIKPQFECGPEYVGKGGIVKSSTARMNACLKVRNIVLTYGLFMTDIIASPVTGGDGNREFLAHFKLRNNHESLMLQPFNIDF